MARTHMSSMSETDRFGPGGCGLPEGPVWASPAVGAMSVVAVGQTPF